ncbi:MAG: glycosyltransferase family 39 protein, partial [Desulfarculales bacterium]|nr:glycosyltransferase family 39 protein [Desulfarculales bacterium]
MGALSLFNFFFLLGDEIIRDWDEARHGVSAYEMAVSGNYIVNTYNFQADYWNAKPPLSLWLTALGYEIFGFNTFALRFFSALCSTVTVLITVIFTGRKLSWAAAFIAGGVLLTLDSFIFEHNARSGDPDAIFILFSTGAILGAILSRGRIWPVYASAFLLSLAFLTKSFHMLSPLLTVLILLALNHGKKLFRLKVGVGFLLSALIPSLVWALLRYSNDGLAFFHIMFGYDVIERSLKAVEGHTGSVFYYLKVLHHDFRQYYILIALLLLALLFCRRRKLR